MKGSSITNFSLGNFSFAEENLTDGNFHSQGDFSMVRSLAYSESAGLVLGQPYRLTEGRIVRILDGTISYTINLQQVSLSRGDVILLSPGTVIEVERISSDCRLQILSFAHDVEQAKATDGSIVVSPSDDEWQMMSEVIGIIWNVISHEARERQTAHLFASLREQIRALYVTDENGEHSQKGNRQRMQFHQFLGLVREHCIHHRDIAFYAERLCVTSQHLSAVVKQVSGVSAGGWITRSVIVEAKLRLSQTDATVSRIADELGFPNPAFFNKFFKRETGMTPGAYRKA